MLPDLIIEVKDADSIWNFEPTHIEETILPSIIHTTKENHKGRLIIVDSRVRKA